MIIPHVLNRQRLNGVGRRFAPGGIVRGEQRRAQGVSGQMVGTLQFAGGGSGQLRLDDLEILLRQRGRNFIFGQQLRAALEFAGQHLQGKIVAG